MSVSPICEAGVARRLLLAGGACALLCVLAAGCGKEDESVESRREALESERWKAKYSALVRKNEETYQEMDELRASRKRLEEEVETLRAKLDAGLADAGDSEVRALNDLLDKRDKEIAGLRQQVKDLRAELEQARAAAGDAEPEGELEQRARTVRGELLETGRELFEADRYEHARKVLGGAAQLGPRTSELLFKMAYCESRLGNEQAAADLYKQALEVATRNPKAHAELLPKIYNNYGATLVLLGRPDEALPLYEEAVAADARYAPVHFNLGRLYAEHLDRKEKAIEAYRRYVALGGERGIAARNAILELQSEKGEEQVEKEAGG